MLDFYDLGDFLQYKLMTTLTLDYFQRLVGLLYIAAFLRRGGRGSGVYIYSFFFPEEKDRSLGTLVKLLWSVEDVELVLVRLEFYHNFWQRSWPSTDA